MESDLLLNLLDYFASISALEAFFWLLIQNILQFVLCVGGGYLLVRLCAERIIYARPDKLSADEIRLAVVCVIGNSLVALAGWYLWKNGIIVIRRETGLAALVDVFVLTMMMDFLMYATHRIVHIPGIFEYVHQTHHRYERVRPLSLFVMSPLEVLGFGSLWLLVLTVYQASWAGIVFYLLLNAAFGALGHVGVEPFPWRWVKIPILRDITTSTFHAQHHRDPDSNFGFYTDIWDRLLGSLNQSYESLFVEAARGKETGS
ncbi:MAG: sterol desaturase family protein [Candidatus Obscuribacterales bacterium]